MEIDIDDIDIDRLRKDLIDHFTAAMFIVNPVAMMDLNRVETASDEEIIQIALSNKFDLRKYIKRKTI